MANNKTVLKYNFPAAIIGDPHLEALIAGNGRVGISVLGGASFETIQISDAMAHEGGKTGVLPDVFDKMRTAKKLIATGDYKLAEFTISDELKKKNYNPSSAKAVPVCDFKISMPVDKAVKEYKRTLNTENGEIEVGFLDDKTRISRSSFVAGNGLIAVLIEKQGAKAIDAEFDFCAASAVSGEKCTAGSAEIKYENFFAYYANELSGGGDIGAVAKITNSGGSMEAFKDSFRIKGADKIFILIKTFKGSREKEFKNIKAELTATKITYDKLLKESSAEFAKKLGSAELDLGASAESRAESVEELLNEAKNSGSMPPALLEKLFYFGKYLIASGATGVSRLAGAGGIWASLVSGESEAPMGEAFLQIYNSALALNMPGAVPSVLDLFEKYYDDLKKNAMRLYGCRGVFVPRIMAPESALLGGNKPQDAHFISGAGLAAIMFYNYYLITGDAKFLKRLIAFSQDVASFYEDFYKFDRLGDLELMPAYSGTTPYNLSEGGRREAGISTSNAFDFAVAREVLSFLISLCEGEAKLKADVSRWKELLERLPEYQLAPAATINAPAGIKEFLAQGLSENPKSAATLYLSPIAFGARAVSPEIEAAAAYSVNSKKYLNSNTSETLAGGAAIMAALGHQSDAESRIYNIVRYAMLNNLMVCENDWTGMGVIKSSGQVNLKLSVNMAVSAIIAQSFVTSKKNYIKLGTGLAENLKKWGFSELPTRAGVTVSADYNSKEINVKLRAVTAAEFTLQLPSGFKKVKGLEKEFNHKTGTCAFKLAAGKSISFKIL